MAIVMNKGLDIHKKYARIYMGGYMTRHNTEIVEQLPDGKAILEIKREIVIQDKPKIITKYAITDKNGIVNILDQNGEMTGIQFFDNYKIMKWGTLLLE